MRVFHENELLEDCGAGRLPPWAASISGACNTRCKQVHPYAFGRLAEADRRYMQGRSFLGDLRIIAATVLGGGAGDAVKG
jgi:hypothetical protein